MIAQTHERKRLLSWMQTYPALLRVGVAEAFAYRAEFLVWLLTTTMPLIMLALWSAVAHEGPFGRFQEADFVAYYLGAYIVRILTGSWVAWELNHEIRTGQLSLRLLRPVHPLVAYAAEHMAAIPIRAALALPVAIILLLTTDGMRLVHDPVNVVMLFPAWAGAWLITFLTMLMIGALGLFIDRSLALYDMWFGLFAVLSGYLVPLELLPPTVAQLAQWLPLRYMLGFPVELLTGMLDRGEALRNLAVQWAYVIVLAVAAHALWHKGLKRFEAFGA